MQYSWRGYNFQVPEGLDDETVVAFLSRNAGAVDYNLTVSRDTKPGKLDAYLADAVAELKKSLSGYQLVDQKTVKAGSRDARVLEHKAVAPDGETLQLKQAYIDCGDEVVIVTGTGTDASKDKLQTAFEKIVSSFS